MITIQTERCIGCRRCAEDCFCEDILVENGKARPRGGRCIECGHCIALCPTNAIALPGYPMEEILSLEGLDCTLSPERYLNHLKSRRSIRRFTPQAVTEEQLHMILEAGRYSPTGVNLQDTCYFVSQTDIVNLKNICMEEIHALAQQAASIGGKLARYSGLLQQIAARYQATGEDKLFFHAGTVIVISAASPQSALIAAAHMETMVYSLGLGALYSGFTTLVINQSPKLQEYIGLQPGLQPYAALVIGQPDVSYLRTAPRKPAKVIRK